MSTITDYEQDFINFIAKYGKEYDTKEDFLYRLSIFKTNWDFVEEFESESIKLAINFFSDLTKEEFEMRTGLLPIPPPSDKPNVVLSGEFKDSVDWREGGHVTPVKNQASCGSCWAFSAIGAVEGLHSIQKGSLVDFSEQQLVECSWDEGNNGCRGGWYDWAWEYHIKQAVTTQSQYPYTADDSVRCHYEPSMKAYHFNGYEMLNEDADQLKRGLNLGPVSVAVGVNDVFRGYSSGVMKPEDGCGEQVNHAITAVGYGTEDGESYFICKNSWGEGWGDNGYIKISARGNTCGVLTRNGYPTA